EQLIEPLTILLDQLDLFGAELRDVNRHILLPQRQAESTVCRLPLLELQQLLAESGPKTAGLWLGLPRSLLDFPVLVETGDTIELRASTRARLQQLSRRLRRLGQRHAPGRLVPVDERDSRRRIQVLGFENGPTQKPALSHAAEAVVPDRLHF